MGKVEVQKSLPQVIAELSPYGHGFLVSAGLSAPTVAGVRVHGDTDSSPKATPVAGLCG